MDDAILDCLIPSSYIAYFAKVLNPGDSATLLAGTTWVGPSPNTLPPRVTLRDTLQVVRNAQASGATPGWHLEITQRMGIHLHGPVTQAILSAPTLGEGVDSYVGFMPQRVPYFAWRGYREAAHWVVELRARVDFGAAEPVLTEIPLLILHEYLTTVRGIPPLGAALQLAYPATPYLDEYPRFFCCPVSFDAGRSALRMPVEWREHSNYGHDRRVWAAARDRCASEARDQACEHIERLVRFEVLHYLDNRRESRSPPSLKTVADRLHVSSRTLIRHLKEAGLRYQEIIDSIQQERAVELLGQPTLTTEQIARAIGFSDASSLGRSFKRWFGTTPGEYRKTLPDVD